MLRIYQLDRKIEETRKFAFAGTKELASLGLGMPEPGMYKKVYEALGDYSSFALEDIYYIFNMDIPGDFTGHSLSVGDVVVIGSGDDEKAYFVDSIGFADVPDFVKRQELGYQPKRGYTAEEKKSIEKAMQDAGWQLNNPNDEHDLWFEHVYDEDLRPMRFDAWDDVQAWVDAMAPEAAIPDPLPRTALHETPAMDVAVIGNWSSLNLEEAPDMRFAAWALHVEKSDRWDDGLSAGESYWNWTLYMADSAGYLAAYDEGWWPIAAGSAAEAAETLMGVIDLPTEVYDDSMTRGWQELPFAVLGDADRQWIDPQPQEAQREVPNPDTLVEAMEAAGLHYDEIANGTLREPEMKDIRFDGEGGHSTYFDSWTDVYEWLEGVVFDKPARTFAVGRVLHPEIYDVNALSDLARRHSSGDELFEALAKNESPLVREVVARNMDTPDDVLRKLANDENYNVRLELAFNPLLPDDVKHALSKDASVIVRRALANEAGLSEDAYRELSNDPSATVRELIARRPDTPIEIIHKLTEDESEEVRTSALNNPAFTAWIEAQEATPDMGPLLEKAVAELGRKDAEYFERKLMSGNWVLVEDAYGAGAPNIYHMGDGMDLWLVNPELGTVEHPKTIETVSENLAALERNGRYNVVVDGEAEVRRRYWRAEANYWGRVHDGYEKRVERAMGFAGYGYFGPGAAFIDGKGQTLSFDSYYEAEDWLRDFADADADTLENIDRILRQNRYARERRILNEDPEDTIVFDLETTGVDPETDEILQIAIVNGAGETLLNTYVRPERHAEWPKAMEVNGITPEMVEDAPRWEDIRTQVEDIFLEAKTIAGYNIKAFDLKFIDRLSDMLPGAYVFDAMEEFAPVHGVWNSKHQDWKWPKLAEMAERYGVTFRAHDALADAEATLECMISLEKDPEYIDKDGLELKRADMLLNGWVEHGKSRQAPGNPALDATLGFYDTTGELAACLYVQESSEEAEDLDGGEIYWDWTLYEKREDGRFDSRDGGLLGGNYEDGAYIAAAEIVRDSGLVVNEIFRSSTALYDVDRDTLEAIQADETAIFSEMRELEAAKALIREYFKMEDLGEPDFGDLGNVPLAYTTLGDDGEHEIRVSADLIGYSIKTWIDDVPVSEHGYESLAKLSEHELAYLDFDAYVKTDAEEREAYRQATGLALYPEDERVYMRILTNKVCCESCKEKEATHVINADGFPDGKHGINFDLCGDCAEEALRTNPDAVLVSGPDGKNPEKLEKPRFYEMWQNEKRKDQSMGETLDISHEEAVLKAADNYWTYARDSYGNSIPKLSFKNMFSGMNFDAWSARVVPDPSEGYGYVVEYTASLRTPQKTITSAYFAEHEEAIRFAVAEAMAQGVLSLHFADDAERKRNGFLMKYDLIDADFEEMDIFPEEPMKTIEACKVLEELRLIPIVREAYENIVSNRKISAMLTEKDKEGHDKGLTDSDRAFLNTCYEKVDARSVMATVLAKKPITKEVLNVPDEIAYRRPQRTTVGNILDASKSMGRAV